MLDVQRYGSRHAGLAHLRRPLVRRSRARVRRAMALLMHEAGAVGRRRGVAVIAVAEAFLSWRS